VSPRGKKTTAAKGRNQATDRPAKSAVDLRIIAGLWRGRRWRFLAAEGVRPTPDRVRETLFNWLAPRIAGARCLDLYAGSGALGLEALSRGAGHVTFVEQQRPVAEALHAQLALWNAGNYELQIADAGTWLAQAAGPPFDIVFLDPPFDAGLTVMVLATLRARHLLAPGGWVYLEQPAGAPLPDDWVLHRSGRAGAVGYHLMHEAQRPVSGHV
jgi:16S rRNA (guanine966-N2)-methyltransferase